MLDKSYKLIYRTGDPLSYSPPARERARVADLVNFSRF